MPTAENLISFLLHELVSPITALSYSLDDINPSFDQTTSTLLKDSTHKLRVYVDFFRIAFAPPGLLIDIPQGLQYAASYCQTKKVAFSYTAQGSHEKEVLPPLFLLLLWVLKTHTGLTQVQAIFKKNDIHLVCDATHKDTSHPLYGSIKEFLDMNISYKNFKLTNNMSDKGVIYTLCFTTK
ncbi:hypothetical protein [Candidatus Hepatobacter penaei]|uniref:hypothetical protein n=1 Tax=Candidatus Hepatobacter penaei TaxID=1274402 RepID=UPI0010939568|nr:hypothetical protein [Candidatus Hepatobacter penaei]TGW14783.1 hypothetical protein EIL50_03980 [bacterium NHP-B]